MWWLRLPELGKPWPEMILEFWVNLLWKIYDFFCVVLAQRDELLKVAQGEEGWLQQTPPGRPEFRTNEEHKEHNRRGGSRLYSQQTHTCCSMHPHINMYTYRECILSSEDKQLGLMGKVREN